MRYYVAQDEYGTGLHVEVEECTECGALVLSSSAYRHRDWHAEHPAEDDIDGRIDAAISGAVEAFPSFDEVREIAEEKAGAMIDRVIEAHCEDNHPEGAR